LNTFEMLEVFACGPEDSSEPSSHWLIVKLDKLRKTYSGNLYIQQGLLVAIISNICPSTFGGSLIDCLIPMRFH